MNSQNNSISHTDRYEKTKKLVMLALFLALTVILSLVPNLGYINIGPISMTTIHIPVIIGAIMLGPEAGAVLGFIFGFMSIIMAPAVAPATAFLFNPFVPFGSFFSVITAIVPRILIGVVAAYLYKFISLKDKKGYFASLAAGIAGALTNTLLVLTCIYVFFGHQYAAVTKIPFDKLLAAIGLVIATNGILEAVLAAILVTGISKALFAAMRRI